MLDEAVRQASRLNLQVSALLPRLVSFHALCCKVEHSLHKSCPTK